MRAMAKHRVPRRNLDRRGVKLLNLETHGWVARWRDPIGGKVRQLSLEPLGIRTAQERQRWAVKKAEALRNLRADIAAGGATSARVALRSSIDEHLATFGNANTRSSKKPPLESFVAWMTERGVRDAQDVTGPLLAGWKDYVMRPRSPHKTGTRNLWLLVTTAWANWARRLGQCPHLTADTITDNLKRVKSGRQAISILRPAQLRELLASCLAHDEKHPKTPIAPLVLATFSTGGRFTEVANLGWHEVDLAEDVIRLDHDRTKTKTAREITLAECPTLRSLLQARKLRAGGAARVFPWITRDVAELARERTMRDHDAPTWTWHMLRRTCGTVLTCSPGIYGGASAFMSARRLGHSIVVAERSYVGALSGLPADAKTLETATGIQEIAESIIAATGGLVQGDDEQTAVAQ